MRTSMVLIPGMGADHRLFEAQKAAFGTLYVPGWLMPGKRETLGEFARRMAGTIAVDGPYVLGGVSMGGMLALEMVRHLAVKPRAVALIASCRSGRVIPRRVRAAERFSRLLPAWVIAMGASSASIVLGGGGGMTQHQREAFMEMYRQTPMEFLRWSARACLAWEFDGRIDVPVHHIHGDRDGLMPVSKVGADRVVRGGGHLINITHAGEVNAWLEAIRQSTCERSI